MVLGLLEEGKKKDAPAAGPRSGVHGRHENEPKRRCGGGAMVETPKGAQGSKQITEGLL